jgi:hypothetical protein
MPGRSRGNAERTNDATSSRSYDEPHCSGAWILASSSDVLAHGGHRRTSAPRSHHSTATTTVQKSQVPRAAGFHELLAQATGLANPVDSKDSQHQVLRRDRPAQAPPWDARPKRVDARAHRLRIFLFAAALIACNSSPTAGAHSASAAPSVARGQEQLAAIRVTHGGFEPVEVKLEQGQPAVLEFTRIADSDCVNAVRMPWLSQTVALPLNESVRIPVDTSKAGTLRYACWMNMVFGRITIVPGGP